MKMVIVYDNLFIEDENYSQLHTKGGVDKMVWGLVFGTVVIYSMLMKYVLKSVTTHKQLKLVEQD
ncbi:hypothetical protein ACQKP0_06840 [Heyndrickxia sp. NPDC080065]|uniref:hypothetical protein n=1 Tax=Heyndrickxia sp. NPDC080065 TaxID=3390568 RepID=UPI003D01A49E